MRGHSDSHQSHYSLEKQERKEGRMRGGVDVASGKRGEAGGGEKGGGGEGREGRREGERRGGGRERGEGEGKRREERGREEGGGRRREGEKEGGRVLLKLHQPLQP